MESNSIGRGNSLRDVALQAGKSKEANKASLESNLRTDADKGLKNSGASVAVNLSSEAKDLVEARNKALQIARETPDIREDRVAALKAKIAAGEYKIDAGSIADGMLREAVKEKLSEMPD
jgi:negative regulator of flagellin synthesis FlgM